MGCKNADGRRNEFLDSRNLYRWAFNNFEYKSLLDTTKPVTEIKVNLSISTDHIPLYAEKDLTKIFPKAADSSTITVRPNLIAESVDAPVKEGDILGTADIIYSEQVIGTVNLVAHNNIKPNIILQIARAFKNFFSSVIFKIILIILLLAAAIYVGIIIKLNLGRSHRRKVKYIPYDKHGKK